MGQQQNELGRVGVERPAVVGDLGSRTDRVKRGQTAVGSTRFAGFRGGRKSKRAEQQHQGSCKR
jgi:hypothetical protein